MQPPLSVRPQDSLRSALDAMVAHGIREIPVTDEVGGLIGLVDEATLAKAYLRIRSTPGEAGGALESVSK